MRFEHFIICAISSLPLTALNQAGSRGDPFTPFRAIQKITNVDGQSGDRFGEKIAVAGKTIAIVARDDDSLATDAGMVYLFDEVGDPVGSFGSPNPENGGKFGFHITSVGDDRFVVSAERENEEAGNVYLFESQGELLATITAPEPLAGRQFGGRELVASKSSLFIASWTERVSGNQDSTRTGAIYEYDHQGDFVARIGHPRPDEALSVNCLGRSAALVSFDSIIVGDACADVEGLLDSGSAFLFNLDGELQQTFDNPAPASLDSFGSSVAFAGGRILIGGLQIDDPDTGASTGAAYVYETNGDLVTRVSDPEPRGGNWFGWNAGSMTLESGEEVFLVGSIFNSATFSKAGKVFVVNRDGEVLQALKSPELGPGGQFGVGFAQLEGKLLIGEPHHGGGFPGGAGAVWVFEQADLGDFDLDGTISEFDLNILCDDLVTGETSMAWDITGDAVVDHKDLEEFLGFTNFVQSDTNFDGQVTFGDFLTLSSNFGDSNATAWSDGNFDCSGHVEFGDFLKLSGNFGKSPATQSVPEPHGFQWLHLFVILSMRKPSLSPTRHS